MKPSTQRLIRLIYQEKGLFTLALGAQFVSKFLDALVPVLFGFLVLPKPIKQVFEEGVFIFFVLVLWGLMELVSAHLRNLLGKKGTKRLRLKTVDHLFKLPIPFFDKTSTGHLSSYLNEDIEKVREMMSDAVIPILGNIFLFFSIFALAYSIHDRLGFLFLFFISIVGIFISLFRKTQKKAFGEFKSMQLDQNRILQERLAGRSLFQQFEKEERGIKKFSDMSDLFSRAVLKVAHFFSLFGSSVDFLIGAVWILSFILFGASAGENGVGNFITFSFWGTILFRPLIELSDRLNTFFSGMMSLEKLSKILEEAPEIDSGTLYPGYFESLSFNKVSFGYSQSHLVLKKLSFEINRGEKIGLVGMTGSGKSTILNLLLRFYEPTEGDILLNGFPLKNYSLRGIRSLFFPLLQEPLIFEATLDENLALYNPYSFKPRGSKQLASNLSAGEKQLLALERALLAKPMFVLMDEVTSALDPETEMVVERKINDLLSQSTSIVVAHRLSTLKELDRVLVLDQGKILEEGTFEELLLKKGFFYKLWEITKGKPEGLALPED